MPWLTLTVCALALVVAAVPGLGTSLALELAPLASGEVWRLWTGHLAHWSGSHLAWDLAVFVVGAAWLERTAGARRLARLLFVGGAVVSAAVLFLRPDLASYRGLSGIDCALVAGVAAHLARVRPRPVLLVAAGLCAKVVYETVTGAGAFAGSLGPGVVVVPEAHVVGALVGALLEFCAPIPTLNESSFSAESSISTDSFSGVDSDADLQGAHPGHALPPRGLRLRGPRQHPAEVQGL
jgi:rhomboid family GlyGly-CTERM serine protease